MGLVRYDIVQYGHDAYPVTPTQAGDRTQTGRHERYPKLDHQHVYMCATNESCGLEPAEGVDTVHRACDGQISRLRIIGILGLTRKKEVGILEGERENLHLLPFGNKLMREPFVERR